MEITTASAIIRYSSFYKPNFKMDSIYENLIYEEL